MTIALMGRLQANTVVAIRMSSSWVFEVFVLPSSGILHRLRSRIPTLAVWQRVDVMRSVLEILTRLRVESFAAL